MASGGTCETQLFDLFTDLHSSAHSIVDVCRLYVDCANAFGKVQRKCFVLEMKATTIDSTAISCTAACFEAIFNTL